MKSQLVCERSRMGDSLSSKLHILNPNYHYFTNPIQCTTCCAGLVFCEIQRELRVAEMERALFELEKRWRGGVEWPQTSKTAWFIKLYTLPYSMV